MSGRSAIFDAASKEFHMQPRKQEAILLCYNNYLIHQSRLHDIRRRRRNGGEESGNHGGERVADNAVVKSNVEPELLRGGVRRELTQVHHRGTKHSWRRTVPKPTDLYK